MSFVGEIKRRHVFRVAAVYAVVAWLIVQVVGELNEPLGLPDGFDTTVIVLLAIGFPVALVLAWAFDLTPGGVVRTPTADSPSAPTQTPGSATTPTTVVEQAPPEPGRDAKGPRPKPLRNSVAVLPLENLSPNPDDAFFAAGVHEEILNQLAKIQALSVIARTSVRRYRDTDKPIAEIAAELGVGTVMEGSVRYAGNRVRVTAQLIDASTENHIWSEVYERDLADVFAIQADVATKIAEALRAELTVAEKQSVQRLPTESTEAYGLYLRALAVFHEHGHSVGALPGPSDSIQSHLDQAIDIDPTFARAYVARASLNLSRLNQDPGVYEESFIRRRELEEQALSDVDRALALDPGIGTAHGILARIHQFNWRGSEAREAYLRALELSPNEIEVLMDFAVFCAITGRFEEAKEYATRGVGLDPSSAQVQEWLTWVLMFCGELPAALDAARRAVRLTPTSVMGHCMSSVILARLGRHEESYEESRVAEHLMRDFTNGAFVSQLAIVYSLIGRPEDVKRIQERIEEIAQTRRMPRMAWIALYLSLGDGEKALEYLIAAGVDPESYVGHFGMAAVKANTFGVPMLDEPRFRAARERVGFRD